jgi:hypothetical protein
MRHISGIRNIRKAETRDLGRIGGSHIRLYFPGREGYFSGCEESGRVEWVARQRERARGVEPQGGRTGEGEASDRKGAGERGGERAKKDGREDQARTKEGGEERREGEASGQQRNGNLKIDFVLV